MPGSWESLARPPPNHRPTTNILFEESHLAIGHFHRARDIIGLLRAVTM